MTTNHVPTIQMPNTLVFAPQDYEKLEKRLLYLCLNKIKEKQLPNEQLSLFVNPENPLDGMDYPEKERTVNIRFEEVKKYGSWRLFQEAIATFHKKSIVYRYNDDKYKERSYEAEINLVEESKWYKGKGATIIFTNRGYKLLTHLSRSYSKIPLEQALKLQSKYSQRLYEMLLARCYGNPVGRWKVDLVEFKRLLGIPEDKYTHWGSLEKITLLKAKEDLGFQDAGGIYHRPLSFDYSTIKQGKKIVGLDFTIMLDVKGTQLHLPVGGMENLSEMQQRCLAILRELNVAEKHHMFIVTTYGHKGSEFWKWNFDRGLNKLNLRNPAGHLLKTLGIV